MVDVVGVADAILDALNVPLVPEPLVTEPALAHSVAPAPEASIAVLAWLRNQGISEVSSDSHRLTFEITVESANKLLSTSFKTFRDTSSGISNVRTTQYSIPDELVKFIDFITPTTYFGVPRFIQKLPPALHTRPKHMRLFQKTKRINFVQLMIHTKPSLRIARRSSKM